MSELCIPFNGPILVAGDSLAKGVSYDAERKRHVLLRDGFCAQVAKFLRPAVQNISRFGLKSGELLSSLRDALKKSERPALVLLEVGGNDCDFDWDAVARDPLAPHLPNTPLPLYEQNLREMIAEIKEAGSQPVLCNLPPIDAERYFRFFTHGDEERANNILQFLGNVGRIYWWHERYSSTVERVAQSTHTPLMLLRAALLEDEDYRAYVSEDGLHLNERGYARLAQITLAYIKQYAPTLLL